MNELSATSTVPAVIADLFNLLGEVELKLYPNDLMEKGENVVSLESIPGLIRDLEKIKERLGRINVSLSVFTPKR